MGIGWAAAAALGIYVGATVLGGLLDPTYSHVGMHISELTSSHAPDRALLSGLYIGYNAALLALGLALLTRVARSGWLTATAGLLVATAVTGVLLVTAFPQDSYGHAATVAGTVHIALAGVAALASTLTVVAAGRAFRRDPGWEQLAGISTVIALVILATGFAGAVGTALESPVMGLLVRLPIGAFLAWLAAVAWHAFRPVPGRAAATGAREKRSARAALH